MTKSENLKVMHISKIPFLKNFDDLIIKDKLHAFNEV